MEMFRTQCVKLHEKLTCSYLDLDGIIREGLLLDQEEVFGRKLTVMEVDGIVQEIMMKWIKGPDDFAGGQDSEPTHINQEPKTKIESEIDDEKPDEQPQKFIESVETENYDSLQEPQQPTVQVITIET